MSSSMRSVVYIPFLQLLHYGVMQFQNMFFLRLLSMYFVGEFDKSMEILRLLSGHPVSAVYKRSLDHFQLFPRYHWQPRLDILCNIIL